MRENDPSPSEAVRTGLDRREPPEFKYPPRQSVGYLLRDTHRAFARAIQARTVGYGVTIGMWSFLRVLWEEDGLTQRELSERVRMMEPTTASALENMEKRGLVARVRNAADRRKINVHLTPAGRELKKKLLPFAAEVNSIALQDVTPEEVEAVRLILRKMRENLDRCRINEPAGNGLAKPIDET